MWLRTATSFAIVLFLTACDDSSPWSVQVCDSCNWESAKIELVDAIPTDSFRITEPIAIEYFNLANEKFPDSAAADKFYTDRVWQYRMLYQLSYYTSTVKPVLAAIGIPMTDTIRSRTVLFFADEKNEYVVDATTYRGTDGVLLFTPGKAPIFWTNEVFRNNCEDTTFVKCYFGK
jgi:hypothetical protein